MNVARAHQNTVLLPDGSMITIGGGVGDDAPNGKRTATEAHKQVELWNPVSREWKLGPSQLENRAYHSTAMLLPDGSVVSAGDDINGGYRRDSYEIYKPPYFFKGERPTISSAPSTAGYGQTFAVGSPDADIARAVLVAPSATTHAVDVNQRVVNLPTVRRGDGSGYDVRTPANVDVAPPGHYMLFLVDTRGRPSVARWTKLDPEVTATTPTPQQPPATGGPTPVTTPPARPVQIPVAEGPVPVGKVTVRAALVRKRVKGIRQTRRVAVRVRSDSAANVTLRATLTRRVPGPASRRTTVGRWTRALQFRQADVRTSTLKLTPAQARRLRGDVRLRLEWKVRRRDGTFVERKVLVERLR